MLESEDKEMRDMINEIHSKPLDDDSASSETGKELRSRSNSIESSGSGSTNSGESSNHSNNNNKKDKKVIVSSQNNNEGKNKYKKKKKNIDKQNCNDNNNKNEQKTDCNSEAASSDISVKGDTSNGSGSAVTKSNDGGLVRKKKGRPRKYPLDKTEPITPKSKKKKISTPKNMYKIANFFSPKHKNLSPKKNLSPCPSKKNNSSPNKGGGGVKRKRESVTPPGNSKKRRVLRSLNEVPEYAVTDHLPDERRACRQKTNSSQPIVVDTKEN